MKKTKKSTKKAKKPQWPKVRNILERPDRLQYVRKMIPSTGCVFCEAADAEPGFASLVLFKSNTAMVVLNKFPYNTGHLLVLPRRHLADLTQTTDNEHLEISALVKHSVAALRRVYRCDGLNIGMNLGAPAGAGIPDHFHWHIVPRWSGDTNFFPIIAETKVLPETLHQSFDRIYPEFEDLKL